jgi:hypothetical protein
MKQQKITVVFDALQEGWYQVENDLCDVMWDRGIRSLGMVIKCGRVIMQWQVQGKKLANGIAQDIKQFLIDMGFTGYQNTVGVTEAK